MVRIMKTMKKVIFLAIVILIMVGCNYTPTDHTTFDGKLVVLIDSCEYIKWSNGSGPNYTHKGNCRFCAERRKQELELLVKQIKEK